MSGNLHLHLLNKELKGFFSERLWFKQNLVSSALSQCVFIAYNYAFERYSLYFSTIPLYLSMQNAMHQPLYPEYFVINLIVYMCQTFTQINDRCQ